MKHIIILDNVSAKSEVVLLHTNILQASVKTRLWGSSSFVTAFFRRCYLNLSEQYENWSRFAEVTVKTKWSTFLDTADKSHTQNRLVI